MEFSKVEKYAIIKVIEKIWIEVKTNPLGELMGCMYELQEVLKFDGPLFDEGLKSDIIYSIITLKKMPNQNKITFLKILEKMTHANDLCYWWDGISTTRFTVNGGLYKQWKEVQSILEKADIYFKLPND
jgi:hypothetical protein